MVAHDAVGVDLDGEAAGEELDAVHQPLLAVRVVASGAGVASAEEGALHAARHDVVVAGVDGVDQESSGVVMAAIVAARRRTVDGKTPRLAVGHRPGVAAARRKRRVRDLLRPVGRGTRVSPRTRNACVPKDASRASARRETVPRPARVQDPGSRRTASVGSVSQAAVPPSTPPPAGRTARSPRPGEGRVATEAGRGDRARPPSGAAPRAARHYFTERLGRDGRPGDVGRDVPRNNHRCADTRTRWTATGICSEMPAKTPVDEYRSIAL